MRFLHLFTRRFQGAFAVRGVRLAHKGSSAWAQSVERLITDLANLNDSTEQDFLAVGSKLTELHSATGQISAEMNALLELQSGECGEAVSQALARMLQDSSERDARLTRSGEALACIRDLARGILLAFSQLQETVSTFRALCTLTRIETARLGGVSSVFANLADEVKPLSESIQAGGEVILKASCRLEESIERSLQHCAGLRSRQLRELPPLMAGIRSAFDALEERRKEVQRTSAGQTKQYLKMSEAIGQLVTSLQAHDITRQQVEHVTHALGQILAQAPAPLSSNAAAVLSLQSRQLLSASEVFQSSMASIESGLQGIATRAQEMADAGRTLVEATGDERDSFVEQMENCFQGILNAVAVFDRGQEEMGTLATGLDETIGRMRGAAAGIQGIEIRIQRIAINAAIGASHIGGSGHALSRIAEAMQDLAHASNAKTESAVAALAAMDEAVKRVSGGTGDQERGSSGEGAEAIQQMRTAVSNLQASGKDSFDRVTRIAGAGGRLCEQIAALCAGFTAGGLFDEVIHHVCGEIGRIREQNAAALKNGPDAGMEPLQNLAKLYTMRRERDVHAAMIPGSASVPPVPEQPASPSEDAGMENVEFF